MPQFDASSAFIREAQRLQDVRKGTPQAIGRAVSTLVRRLPVEARRDIQTEYALPAARIAQDLTTTKDETSVTLIGKARPIGLEAFGGRWGGPKTAGATATVLLSEGAHTYAGTFIAIGKNGNRQIFSRKIVGGRRAGRLPLKALLGPNVASMLRKGEREERLADFAQATLATEINRLLDLSAP